MPIKIRLLWKRQIAYNTKNHPKLLPDKVKEKSQSLKES